MSQYYKFLKYFAGFAIIYFAATFFSNLLVDPYGVWKNGGRVQNGLVIKAIKVHQKNPKTLILGTSGVVSGLNPNDESFSDAQPVYNLGLFGANIYEIKHYFHHAVTENEDLEKVVLGLDFYTFNKFREVRPDFSLQRLGSKYRMLYDVPGLYLSLDSLELVLNKERRGQYFGEQGEYIRQDKADLVYVFEREILEDLSEEGMYTPYQLSAQKLNDFRETIQTARAKSLETQVFLPPIHVTMFHTLMISDYWSDYERWLKEVVKIEPVWDFSGCNSMTTETISTQMENYHDATHYTQRLGNLILKQLSTGEKAKAVPNFGVYVTPHNVEAHLTTIKKQCETWQKNNPEIVNWVENLKQQVPTTQS